MLPSIKFGPNLYNLKRVSSLFLVEQIFSKKKANNMNSAIYKLRKEVHINRRWDPDAKKIHNCSLNHVGFSIK